MALSFSFDLGKHFRDIFLRSMVAVRCFRCSKKVCVSLPTLVLLGLLAIMVYTIRRLEIRAVRASLSSCLLVARSMGKKTLSFNWYSFIEPSSGSCLATTCLATTFFNHGFFSHGFFGFPWCSGCFLGLF